MRDERDRERSDRGGSDSMRSRRRNSSNSDRENERRSDRLDKDDRGSDRISKGRDNEPRYRDDRYDRTRPRRSRSESSRSNSERRPGKSRHGQRSRDRNELRERHSRHKRTSLSPETRPKNPSRQYRQRSKSRSRSPNHPSFDPSLPPPIQKEKPNYNPTGLLAHEANTINKPSNASFSARNRESATTVPIVLKYHEPSNARLPSKKSTWRIYHFSSSTNPLKKEEMYPLNEKSVWLIGREGSICDILLDNKESKGCSKQHAVIQFRYMKEVNEYGDDVGRVKGYILDLNSKGGTFLNGERIEEERYVELKSGDGLKFGQDQDGGEWVVVIEEDNGEMKS